MLATPRLAPAATSSRICKAPLGKEAPARRKGGEELARDGPVLATQTRALPGSQVLDVRTTHCIPECCLVGSGALGSSPAMPTHRLCMTMLGWEVPLLQILHFFQSSTVVHCTKQDPEVRSLFPPHKQYRGSQGACGCRERKQDSAVFPAPSPPLRPAPPSFPARVTPPGASGKFL